MSTSAISDTTHQQLSFACHDHDIQPSYFNREYNARSRADKAMMMMEGTIRYNKQEHSDVPVEQFLACIKDDLDSIQHIDCSETLNTESVKALCKLLLHNPAHTKVQTLSLKRSELDKHAAEALATLLYANTTIQSLDLCFNKLGPEGVNALVQPLVSTNTALVTLNLSHNDLKVKGATFVATLLKHNRTLQHLKLDWNHFGTRGIKVLAPWLAACTSLKSLCLAHNHLGAKGVSLLATEFEEATAAAQGQDSSSTSSSRRRRHCLEHLDLSCNRATTRGCQALTSWLSGGNRSVVAVHTLMLTSNEICQFGAAAIAVCLRYNHTLRHLMLGGNHVGDAGARTIAESLQESPHLETLHLDWNHIGDEGAQALGRALERNSSLRILDLGGNQVSNGGGVALAKALPFNVALETLFLKTNQLGDVAADAFADALVSDKPNRSFQRLECEENAITERGKCRLEGAFRYRRNFRVWFERTLQDLSKLTTLDLTSRTIGDDEVIALANRLSALNSKSALQTLFIGGTFVTARGTLGLTKSYLADAESCRLTRLYVRESCIGDAGAASIAVALKTNRSLQILSLTSSGIAMAGAKALSDVLRENPSLRRLQLDGNRIGDEGLAALVNGLGQSVTVTALSVAKNNITNDGIGNIARTHLKELNLSDNAITDHGAFDIARSLVDGCEFERLCLSGNHLSSRGGQALAVFLPPTTTFQY